MEPTDEVQREPVGRGPDAVIEVDPTGRIELADERAELVFGWPAEDLVGTPVHLLVADRLAEPGPRPPGVDLLLSARRRDGSQFPAEVSLTPVTGDDSRRRVRITIRDCTPPRSTEVGGEQPPGDADREPSPPMSLADLSRVAHDLNNVLSVMLIYSELIERAVEDRSMDEYLGEIRTAAEHGAELTGRLQQLARQSATDPAVIAESARHRMDEDLLLRAIRRHSASAAPAGTVGVVVVDDHRMFAEGLARLLGSEDDIEVLGIGANGREAVSLVEQFRPRVLLLDFDMPEGNGVLAATEVKERWPETMIVMVSGSTDDRRLLRAIEAGCSGYLTKDRAASEVAAAVRTVAAGEALISPAQMARLLPKLAKSHRGVASDLTAPELEVLDLLARGATTASIAAELSKSPEAARDDVDGILRKLGAHSTLEAVATAIREGVIEYNSPF